MGRWLVLLSLLLLCGCQHVQVQKQSNLLSGSVPGLYYGQVLDNLAQVAVQPYAMAHFGVPTQGTSTNTRQVQANYTLGWDFIATFGRYLFDKQRCPFRDPHLLAPPAARQASGFLNQEDCDGAASTRPSEGGVLRRAA